MKEIDAIGHIGAGKIAVVEHIATTRDMVVISEPEPIAIKNYRSGLEPLPKLVDIGPMPPRPKHRNGKYNKPNRKFQKKQKKARKNNRKKR